MLIKKETELMDTLDNCVSQFFSLEGVTPEDKKEFVKFIREAQKTLALVSIRNIETNQEKELSIENCSLCKEFLEGIHDFDCWCKLHKCYTTKAESCDDFKRK